MNKFGIIIIIALSKTMAIQIQSTQNCFLSINTLLNDQRKEVVSQPNNVLSTPNFTQNLICRLGTFEINSC